MVGGRMLAAGKKPDLCVESNVVDCINQIRFIVTVALEGKVFLGSARGTTRNVSQCKESSVVRTKPRDARQLLAKQCQLARTCCGRLAPRIG